MKYRMVDALRCPSCQARLDLQAPQEGPSEPIGEVVAAPVCRDECALEGGPVDGQRRRPDCTACLGREIETAVLVCRSCARTYPVRAGIPRFTAGVPAGPERSDRRSGRSFSLQWHRYDYGDRTWFKDDLELRRHEFAVGMDLAPDDLRGRFVLDAGCGNGQLTSALTMYGLEIVGMDLTDSVERAYAHCRQPGVRAHAVHFVQADLLAPPFGPGTFDHVHTSGVIHHTPSTAEAFRRLLSLVRPGGRIYAQVYRTRPLWVGLPNRLIRLVTTRLPVSFLYWVCYTAVPLHTAAVVVVARIRREDSPIRRASRRERALSMFDNYSPTFQHRHSPAWLRRLFLDSGLHDVKDTTLANESRHMVAFVGRKPEVS